MLPTICAMCPQKIITRAKVHLKCNFVNKSALFPQAAPCPFSILGRTLLKQIKQIRITLMTMFKVTTSPPNEVRWSVPNDTELEWLLSCLFCTWLQCIRLCAWKKQLLTSKLDNCNEVGSQLPHNAHISMVSCLNNPGERNDVLEDSVHVQNV